MHVRWLIIGLVFLATVINYLDRLTISVLAPVITKELQLSNLEFAQVGVWFLVAYTISQALSGRLYDRIGSKRGFTASVIVWSSAAAATATATTVGALSAPTVVAVAVAAAAEDQTMTDAVKPRFEPMRS